VDPRIVAPAGGGVHDPDGGVLPDQKAKRA
jgi:hypothetical protein